MTLTRADIISEIQDKLGFTKRQSAELTEQIVEIIKSTLANGEDVRVSRFGKFCVNDKNARKGRNPATGEDMMLKPRRVVTFKCSGKLRKRVSGI